MLFVASSIRLLANSLRITLDRILGVKVELEMRLSERFSLTSLLIIAGFAGVIGFLVFVFSLAGWMLSGGTPIS